jgi:predicted nucleic acid-binding Zn ribbon protein
MPFCPDCGIKVSEDTRFCPECGRPLVIEQTAKRTSKTKLAGIIAACIIAIIVIVVIAIRPPISIEPEPAIPAHFTTYTDELGLFSISYPPEWELALELIEEAEQAMNDLIRSIDSGLPVEQVSCLFAAGIPSGINLIPSVSITVESLPGIVWTHDVVVRAEIESAKAIASNYYEFSRVKTTVDNRTATIIVSQATIPQRVTCRYEQMMLLVGKTVWIVTCTALPDQYGEWEDDFDAIVRSLRILK